MKVCESEKIKELIRESFRGKHDFLADAICNIIEKYSFEIEYKDIKEKTREE